MQIVAIATTWILSHMRRENGQDLIEYAGLGGIIALALVVLLATGLLQGAVTEMATNIEKCVDFDAASVCAGGL